LDSSDTQAMTEQLRRGLVAKAPAVELTGEVEPDARAASGIDEVYVVAGHKGQPAAVAKWGGSDGAAGWRVRRAAARWRRTSHPSSMCNRPRSSRSSRQQSRRTPSFTRTSMASTRLYQPEARAQDSLPWTRRVCPRRGRGRPLQGACQHDRSLLLAAALLAAPAPGHLARQAAALPRLLPARAQRSPTWQSPAGRPYRRPGCVTNLPPPRNPTRATRAQHGDCEYRRTPEADDGWPPAKRHRLFRLACGPAKGLEDGAAILHDQRQVAQHLLQRVGGVGRRVGRGRDDPGGQEGSGVLPKAAELVAPGPGRF